MKVLAPIAITAAMLTSSTIAEDEYAAWSNATGYTQGARVIKGHKVWQSVNASTNTNHDPETDTGTWWIEVGPTNRHAMFDGSVVTASTSSTDIVVMLTPLAIVNGLAIIAGVGSRVRVQMHDENDVQVYDSTKSLNSTPIRNWEEYFFAAQQLAGELLFEGLPRYFHGVITVTVFASAGAAAVGALVLGRVHDLGVTLAPSQLGGIDYSYIDTNSFGTTKFAPGARVRRTTQRVLVEAPEVRRVDQVLGQMSASPAVWIGVADSEGTMFSVLIVFGIRRDYSFDFESGEDGFAVLTIEIIGIANATA